jgi:NADP-reducing hydrogenase subunit HndA
MCAEKCCCCNTDEKDQELLKIIEKYKEKKGALIPILHETQELYGYLSELQ